MAVKIEEALELIYKNVRKKSTKLLPIESALGFILAQDVVAKHNLPPFDNSAMDGYAVRVLDAGKKVKVKHTVLAGDNSSEELEDGYGIKIMTGAKIPKNTQAIVPIEDVNLFDDGVELPKKIKLSNHIRLAGEDIKIGDSLLSDGDKLNAYQITILASQGISHIKVYKKPRIAIFASGSELKMHFENVEEYQLYNTNTPTLLARALELGCEVDFIGSAEDTLDELKSHIQSATDADLIITSGGVSVGDADYTKEAFSAYDYEVFFDKVDIKPGKPTTFGKLGDSFVLNLPGNPLAAYMNFELFGKSIILAMSGTKDKYLNTIDAKMKNDYKIRKGRRNLVPGFFDGDFFEVCPKFAPGMVSPLANSNSFIMISEDCDFIAKGESVKTLSTMFSFTTQEQKTLVS